MKFFICPNLGYMTNGSVLPSMVGFFFISSQVDTVALGRKPKL